MDEDNSTKKMAWGILFGLLFIGAAGIAWLFSKGTADLVSLGILSGIGLLIIVVTVAKVHTNHWYFKVIAVLGVIMVGIGLIVTLSGAIPEGGVSLITGGFIMAFIGGISLTRSEDKGIIDERSLKIGRYGTSLSWYVTFMTVFLFYFLDMLGLFEQQVSTILVCLMVLMIGSALFFQWYYNRKGDVY